MEAEAWEGLGGREAGARGGRTRAVVCGAQTRAMVGARATTRWWEHVWVSRLRTAHISRAGAVLLDARGRAGG